MTIAWVLVVVYAIGTVAGNFYTWESQPFLSKETCIEKGKEIVEIYVQSPAENIPVAGKPFIEFNCIPMLNKALEDG